MWRIFLAILLFAALLAGCSWLGGGGNESEEPPGGSTELPPASAPQGSEPPADEPAQPPVKEPDKQPPSDPIQERLRTMSLADKIGQMVMVGIEGRYLNEDMTAWFEEGRIGGVILYGGNIVNAEQTIELVNGLKQASGAAGIEPPLFIATDQEGGLVSRLPDESGEFPAARTIGETGDPQYALSIGRAIGQAMAALGMNMDFAPVLDIDTNPDNPVIGNRAFGTTPEAVIRMGIPVMDGIRTEGVIPVVKHFPGHGDTEEDSHLGLPVVTHDRERLDRVELVPFAAAIEQGADVVMVAHLLMRALDPDVPSSMSPVVIGELLRDELKFDGVAITDDMTMGAVTEHYDIGRASVDALLAGADIVLIGHEPELQRRALEAIRHAAASGELSQDAIDDHVYRILKLKEKYGLSNDPVDPAAD
jgi:beta-N-acetylhexosaminidase